MKFKEKPNVKIGIVLAFGEIMSYLCIVIDKGHDNVELKNR